MGRSKIRFHSLSLIDTDAFVTFELFQCRLTHRLAEWISRSNDAIKRRCKMDDRRHARLLFKTVSWAAINHGRAALSRPINGSAFERDTMPTTKDDIDTLISNRRLIVTSRWHSACRGDEQ